MDMNTLLESLYENNTSAGQEKTAEDAMFAQLSDAPKQDNPFMDLPMEDLVKLAQELEVAPAEEAEAANTAAAAAIAMADTEAAIGAQQDAQAAQAATDAANAAAQAAEGSGETPNGSSSDGDDVIDAEFTETK